MSYAKLLGMSEINPIAKAADVLGSQAALAAVIQRSPSMVNQMIKGVRPVPAEHCPLIERATSGKVRCEELRPDVDWTYLRGTKLAEEGSHA